MPTLYWYRVCAACNQGRLEIMEDVPRHRLYLHCEECEMGFLVDEATGELRDQFLTFAEDFEAEAPSADRIAAYAWSRFIEGEFGN